MSATYWNGEPCEARRVLVEVVDSHPLSRAWFRELVGTRRRAVEVTYARGRFLIDDDAQPEREIQIPGVGPFTSPAREPGWGWRKITEGRGSPNWPHASLPAACPIVEAVEG